MGHKKTNYAAYSSFAKNDDFSKAVNISDLIKRNKMAEQKDKLLKIFTLGFSGLILLFVIFIFL